MSTHTFQQILTSELKILREARSTPTLVNPISLEHTEELLFYQSALAYNEKEHQHPSTVFRVSKYFVRVERRIKWVRVTKQDETSNYRAARGFQPAAPFVFSAHGGGIHYTIHYSDSF
jgi:hypothetical protein